MPVFDFFTRKKSDAYKKGHLGQENTLIYDAKIKQWYDPSQGLPNATTLAPPPKGSLATAAAKGALEAEAASPTNSAGPSADTFGRASSLASRYAKPTGASQAGGSTPAVVLPVPGLAGRGRGGLGGRGGRGGAIRTFVPQTSGATAITPAWMTKKASTGSPSEETSSSTIANPFADPTPSEGPAPQPNPSVFMPAATAQDTAVGPSPFASPFASAPPASASSGMLTQLSQSSAIPDSAQPAAESAADDSYAQPPAVMDAESASLNVPADSALSTSQGVPDPSLDPSLNPSSTPQPMDDTQMEGQDSTRCSPLDDAFGGDSTLEHTFGGGNGGGSALDDTFGGGSSGGLDDAFNGGGGTGGGLDDAFNGGGGRGGGLDDAFNGSGGGLDDAFNAGGGSGGGLDKAFNGGGTSGGGLDDAFGGGNGASGLDDNYGGSSLHGTSGGALMAGDIGQAGPMMPPADTTGDASGPKFPSRDGSETRAGEDFFGNLSGVEGGAVDDQEASSSSPALNESAEQEAPPQEEGGYDIAAMEVLASEAVSKDYHGLDWQRVMEIAQGWRDLGYPEEDVKGYLADYGVDLEVYAYWVWRYYPDWLIWWQDYGSQANQESGATAEGAATAVDSAQDSAHEPPQEAQPMDSEQQPAESDTQVDYPLSFSLGGGSEAVSEFPNFGVSAHPGDLEEMEINLGGDSANHDESLPAADGDDYAAESGAVSLEQPAEIESTAALHDSASMPAGPSQHDESDESTLMTTETSHHADESASALAAEDSFQADGRGSIAQTLQRSPTRAQNPFGENADEAPDTTWHNPVWDMSASPEQASRAPSPFFGVGPGVGANPSADEASTSQGGVGAVTRELSFGLSSPHAGVKKENGVPQAGVKQENGAAVQHVESLGAWAQNQAHRKPSIKLEGPLPWDLLSESSEEELTPRQARRTVEDLEEEDQDMQPEANGSAVPKAPAPEASEATARTMSIGDQIAFGKRNVASLFQEASRGLGQQLRSSFALPSSSSPPKLYQRSPHLVQIYGDDSEEEEEENEADEAVRLSGRETPKAARRLSMGPDTPMDQSPAVTPRSTQGPLSEKELAPSQEEQSEEAEPQQPRRKKTGDEPSSRERSPEDHFAAGDQVEVDEEERAGVDEEEQVWADEEEQESSEAAEDDIASDEGWEGMDDVEIPLPEDSTAVAPEVAAEADSTTAVEAEPAVVSAEDQQEQAGDHTVPVGPFGDDDNEGWEDMEDLTVPLEVAEAAEQEAAVEPETAHEAESQEDGSNQQLETVGSPTAPSDLAGDQPAANGDQGVVSRDELIPNIFSGDDDAAEEGWEGLHDQDVPGAEHEDSSAHPEDQVAEPERRSAESEEGSSEREAHLEAQVEALRSELASRHTQLASLTLQLGERDSASAELSTQTSELSSSHQQLTSELEDSRQQLSATQAELDCSAQAAESWQSQLAALQASSAAETACLRQQLTEAGDKSAEEEEKAWAAQQDADKWRSQFEEVQASSNSAAAAAAQNEEQLRQDIATARSEVEAILESHRATLAEIQGSLDDACEQLTAVTSDQSSLADQVAASSSELDSLAQQRDRAEIKSAELSEQLDSVAEQLRGSELTCSELGKEVEALRETHAQQETNSESRHAKLSEQLEETRAAHARLESEYELLTQQMGGDGGKASPQSAGSSPQRKVQALLEELEDYRGKMGVADACIIDLEEQKAQLEEAKAAAEAASKEAFALREKQTERIKRTKAGGPAGLPVVTAEREDARRRAEQAEFEMRELRAECKSLMDRLQAQSASMQPIDSELSRSQVDSAPVQAPDSPPSQAPASTQGDSSKLNATELTRQLEEAAVKISSLEADIVSLHAQVVTRNAEFESSRAALSTELALMPQQAEQLSSEQDQATQHAESFFAERDSFAEKAQELEAELAESTLRSESLSAEKEELKQQLEGLLAGAEQTSEAQDEVQKLQAQLSQLQEQLQHKEEEVRRLEEEQGQLHQKVQSLGEEAQESFEQLTGKEEECDRLEALLETAREGNAQQASEQLESLHADLASLRQQLMSSEEQVQFLEQDLQDRVGSSEALQAAEEQLSQATQAAQSLSAELESSQGESRRLRQEFEQQIEMLTQQLRDQVKETDDALQNAMAAEKAKDKVDIEVAAVRARILYLEADLTAAEGARDEFVYHLSPKKPPRPAGSPAPKANADQLRAALKAAREHAAGLEASAEREMASADEAYMLLGEAHSTMALYEAVLLQNDLDPEFVRSLNAGDASFSDDDEDDAVELASVASAAGDEDAVPSEVGGDAGAPGELGGDSAPPRELGDDSAVPGEAGDEAPESTHRGAADDPGYDSPTRSSREGHSEEPLLEPSASPVAAIRFMKPASPAHQQEMSLDAWGVGQAASGVDQGVEGWEDEDDWWKQDS